MALYRAVVSGSLFGQLIQNVLHFHRADAPADGAFVLAQSLRDHFYAQIRLLVNSDMTFNLVQIYDAESISTLPVQLPMNLVGAWATHHVVWAPLCAVFQIKTADAGRHGRGRFYISGQEQQGIFQGLWETNRQILMNSAASSIKGGYCDPSPSSMYTLGVMKRGGSTADFRPAIDLIARPLPGTQGRRNIGRGN